MKIKKQIIQVACLLIVGVCFGQELPDLIPLSPEAASLSKHIETPVSLYTGTAQISVPIYTIEANGVNLPITLNYTTSGVTVSQESSVVGLGWSLNAGGMISRVIRGNGDFSQTQGRTGYINSFLPTLTPENYVDFASLENNSRYSGPAGRSAFFSDISSGTIDLEPDVFYFNFLGFSGKFYFENCYPCPQGPYKPVFEKGGDSFLDIEYNKGSREWTVKDGKGNTYYFGTTETSYNSSGSFHTLSNDGSSTEINGHAPQSLLYPSDSSWRLDKIVTATNDEIIFEYLTNNDLNENKEYATLTQPRESESVIYYHSGSSTSSPVSCDCVDGDGPNPCGTYTARGRTVTTSRSIIRNAYLKRVNFKNGYVDFKYSEREDLIKPDADVLVNRFSKPLKLDQIDVYSINESNVSKNITSYLLENSYFKRNSSDTDAKYLRLKLDAVQQVKGNEALPPYTFAYHQSTTIPSKTSRSIDHWGYYNGTNNRGTLIPSNDYNEDGADRQPVDNYADLFMLKEVTFPSKGKHSYTYEKNKYYTTRNTTITEVRRFNLLNGDTYACDQLGCVNNPWTCNDYQGGCDDCNWCDYHKPEQILEFEITQDMISNMGFDFYFTINGGEEYSGNYGPNSSFWFARMFEIDGPQGNELRTVHSNNFYYPDNPADYSDDTGYAYSVRFSMNNNIYGNRSITPGWYRLVLKSEFKDVEVYADVSYKKNITETINDSRNFVGPGTRISQITLDDSKGNTISKHYSYDRMVNEESRSTAKILSDPQYVRTIDTYEGQEGAQIQTNAFNLGFTDTRCEFTTIINGFSDSFKMLSGSAHGNNLGYSSVKEALSNGGYTIYNYINDEDAFPAYFFPNMPMAGNPANGNLLYKNHFDAEGNPVKTETYNYDIVFDPDDFLHENPDIKYLTAVKTHSLNIYNSGSNVGSYDRLKGYRIPLYKQIKLNSVEVQEHFANDEIYKQETLYTYHDANKQISSETIKTSTNNPIITKYYYPTDVLLNNSLGLNNLSMDEREAIDKLKQYDLHRINETIQTQTYRDLNNNGETEPEEMVNAQRTNYYIHPVSGLVLPKKVLFHKGKYIPNFNQLRDRIIYEDYDNSGNPIEVRTSKGIHIIYVWGYNKKYPIAKIEHATFKQNRSNTVTEIQQTLINDAVDATINESTDITENNLRLKLQSLRSGFPKAMVTTYTYDPLIGITSITDSRGYTMYYEYDEFNRLQYVKDSEENILTKNEYNYKQ